MCPRFKTTLTSVFLISPKWYPYFSFKQFGRIVLSILDSLHCTSTCILKRSCYVSSMIANTSYCPSLFDISSGFSKVYTSPVRSILFLLFFAIF